MLWVRVEGGLNQGVGSSGGGRVEKLKDKWIWLTEWSKMTQVWLVL